MILFSLFQVFGLILSYVVVLFKFALIVTEKDDPPTMPTTEFRNVTDYMDYR